VTSDGLALHHLVALGLEVAPERREHRFHWARPPETVVELVLHLGGEVVADVALEEALEERGQQAARILGEEAVLLGADVVAVLEHLDRRGVSRRPADAELLEPLDQARLE
jgi:hypothetical protein